MSSSTHRIPDGRVALVTGASAGIGLEVARGLARQGMRVVLACRDRGRGEKARDDIARSTGRNDLDLRLVDFSRQRSIRAFAREIAEAYPALHVLVNNAGGWSSLRKLTEDRVEQTWATNMLGYFLTTELLRPLLEAGAPARIVNVASQLAHSLDLDDVNYERRRYSGMDAYAQSKQANRMWTWALARRLEGTNVTANALHPGGVNTGIFAKGGGLLGMAASVYASVGGRTPEAGADTVVWLASSREVDGKSGGFFIDRRERRCPFRNEEQEEKLWALCARMTA